MSINEDDLPVSRRYTTETTFPRRHSTTSQQSLELPDGARKFNVEVGFPQSHVLPGHSETIEFVSGPKGDPGPPGPEGQWEAMTQAQFEALPVKDPDVLYVIVPG